MKKRNKITLIALLSSILLAGCSLPVCDTSSFTAKEREAVAKKEIFIGMSEKALNCSWGSTGIYGRINRSLSSRGEVKQYVFKQHRYDKTKYVYVINGKVSTIQD